MAKRKKEDKTLLVFNFKAIWQTTHSHNKKLTHIHTHCWTHQNQSHQTWQECQISPDRRHSPKFNDTPNNVSRLANSWFLKFHFSTPSCAPRKIVWGCEKSYLYQQNEAGGRPAGGGLFSTRQPREHSHKQRCGNSHTIFFLHCFVSFAFVIFINSYSINKYLFFALAAIYWFIKKNERQTKFINFLFYGVYFSTVFPVVRTRWVFRWGKKWVKPETFVCLGTRCSLICCNTQKMNGVRYRTVIESLSLNSSYRPIKFHSNGFWGEAVGWIDFWKV
jgi:hypothetical protein